MREDLDLPDPPPLPASHPTQKDRWRDSLRIPALFYLEVLAGQLLLVVLVFALGRFIPWVRPVAIFGQPLLWFYLMYRLARRVIESRNARGKPRAEATAIFALGMILPAVAAFFWGMYLVEQNREPPSSAEARMALQEIARAERQFKKDFGRFTLNARELGYQIPENVQPRYVLGFATTCSVKAGVDQGKAQWLVEDPTFIRAKRAEIDALFLNLRQAEDCKDPQEGFEAFAVGAMHQGGTIDVWQIDERGRLANPQRGN